MIYPAQTSLIPVQIALAKFLETNGFAAIFSNYPYWYLGTTPYRYLTGPILPFFLAGIHKAFPQLPLFTIFYLLIAFAWLLGGLGLFLLIKELSGYVPGTLRKLAGISALFYLFGPIVPFFFPFSDGLSLISFSFLPFVLLLYVRFLKKPKPSFLDPSGLALGAAISFLLLLNISIIPTLFIGMAAVFLAVTGWEHAEEKLKKSLLLIAYCLLLITLWYSPGFWLARLGVPSLAGRHLIQVVLDLGKLLPAALAITAAFVSVKFFKKRDILRDFVFYWLFIFGFLTLIRFISDPDFWLDWSAYSTEIQLGLAVVGGLLVNRVLEGREVKSSRQFGGQAPFKVQNGSLKFRNFLFSPENKVVSGANALILICIFTFYFLIFTFTTNAFVVGTLQPDISQTVEYRIGLKLAEIIGAGRTPRQGNLVPPRNPASSTPGVERGVERETPGVFPAGEESADHGARVLLSGTTAFWLNAFFDIPQVRGGVDQASVDPNWRKAVWEIREGTDPEKSLEWLRTLNVSYLVVHTEESEEYYHDFTYPEKFEEAAGFEKIYDVGGDRIYRIRN